MILRLRNLARLLPFLALLVGLFPSESSALIRQPIDTDSLFDEAFQNCRNDPVNFTDPLGLQAAYNSLSMFCEQYNNSTPAQQKQMMEQMGKTQCGQVNAVVMLVPRTLMVLGAPKYQPFEMLCPQMFQFRMQEMQSYVQACDSLEKSVKASWKNIGVDSDSFEFGMGDASVNIGLAAYGGFQLGCGTWEAFASFRATTPKWTSLPAPKYGPLIENMPKTPALPEPPLLPTAKSEVMTVRTYTGAAGREGITSSGALNADTWVTLPGEIPPRAGHLQIEKLLEIKPGRGGNYIDFEVQASNLRVPANGPRTSGDALQFQLKEPVTINPNTFRRPPGRPGG